MNDFESRHEQKMRYREERRKQRDDFRDRIRDRWGNREYGVHRGNTIWTGLFILLVGVAALMKVSVPDLPRWIFSWATFLIGLGFFIGIRHNFRGVAWFILMIIGGISLFDHLNPDISIRPYIWPLALIIVGLFFIARPRRRHWQSSTEKKTTDMQDNSIHGYAETMSDDDYIDSTSIFGGAKKKIISKNFKGGDLVNIFGGTDLDLMQADFTGTATLELTTIFGGTKLVVPSNWAVKSDAVIIFGGIEDKRSMLPAGAIPEKTLLLRGTVIFGGIEIKS